LISWRYQNALRFVLTTPKSNTDITLWALLENLYAADVEEIVGNVARDFIGPPSSGLHQLITFTELGLERLASCHTIGQYLWFATNLSHRVLVLAGEQTRVSKSSAESTVWAAVPRTVGRLVEVMYDQLVDLVKKQASLPRDFIKDACFNLTALLVAIAQADRGLAEEMFQAKGGTPKVTEDADTLPFALDDVDLETLSQLVTRAWKLSFLKSCIKSGRMEARTQGLESLMSDLVDAFNHNQREPERPVMQ
jgi:hypothetical protein